MRTIFFCCLFRFRSLVIIVPLLCQALQRHLEIISLQWDDGEMDHVARDSTETSSKSSTSREKESEKTKSTRADVLALIRRKDEIEATIKALHELLASQGNVGMDGPLLDNEGFPRNDIDVYSVRHARHSIICLNNDHFALMKEIEEGLYKVHAMTRTEFMDLSSTEPPEDVTDLHPFAKIQFVMTDSPAASAGLLSGDLILVFGSATDQNFRSLQDIAIIVGNSENRSIPLKIKRNGTVKHLDLTPRKWNGKGLLGQVVTGLRTCRGLEKEPAK